MEEALQKRLGRGGESQVMGKTRSTSEMEHVSSIQKGKHLDGRDDLIPEELPSTIKNE